MKLPIVELHGEHSNKILMLKSRFVIHLMKKGIQNTSPFKIREASLVKSRRVAWFTIIKDTTNLRTGDFTNTK